MSSSVAFSDIRGAGVLAHLPDDKVQSLIAQAELEQVGAGEAVAANCGLDYLVLLEGQLEVSRVRSGPDGSRQVSVGTIEPREGGALSAVPRQSTVRARTPSKFLRLDGEKVDELLAWSQSLHSMTDAGGTDGHFEILGRAPVFREVPAINMEKAFARLKPLDVSADQTVITQGERGETYYIIETGRAEVWRRDPIDDTTKCVAKLGAGDTFGEEALLLGGFRNATVTMTRPGRLWTLTKADFDELLKPALVEEVIPETARLMLDEGKAKLLDCRYDIEFEEANIPGAVLMPLDTLREQCAALDKGETYIVYCRSGRRSACAAFLLRERGFNALSLVGGIRDWPYEVQSTY